MFFILGDGEMENNSLKNVITTLVRMAITACVVFAFFGQSMNHTLHVRAMEKHTERIIFTAPSAEKLYDGTPLREQIDVTAQGLPEGYTYKAVAEGSVTYPEDNTEDNNIVTDYIIYDPNGLNVTDQFVNVVTRPGTLRVSYTKENVLGARRDRATGKEIAVNTDSSQEVVIEDEGTPLADGAGNTAIKGNTPDTSVEIFIYGILFLIMLIVFGLFITDSSKMRAK
ncbi:hypothetical protein [Butyrivibrio sp. AE3006]|uniref:hypothetical protein n=1 Tax=Butyrivibrio sp. AE3006 TaxID=1280673 RepID=UPI00047D1F4D|nr:hypothetical protein [Butyrivibrio sp. AE3006]